MYCWKCGASTDSAVRFCIHCGAPVRVAGNAAPQDAAGTTAASPPSQSAPAAVRHTPVTVTPSAVKPAALTRSAAEQQPVRVRQPAQPRPPRMRWHNALVRFFLPVFGVLSCLYGALTFVFDYLGNRFFTYDPSLALREMIRQYGEKPWLFVYAALFGGAAVAAGCFALYVRSRLRGFASDAPKKLTALFVFLLGFALLRNIAEALNAAFAGRSVFPSVFAGVRYAAVLLVLMLTSRVYYRRRRAMFDGTDSNGDSDE